MGEKSTSIYYLFITSVFYTLNGWNLHCIYNDVFSLIHAGMGTKTHFVSSIHLLLPTNNGSKTTILTFMLLSSKLFIFPVPIVEIMQRVDELEEKIEQVLNESPMSSHSVSESMSSLANKKQSSNMSMSTKVGRPRLGTSSRGRGRGRGKGQTTRTSAMARVLSSFPSRDSRGKVTRSTAAAGIAAAAAKVKNTKIGDDEAGDKCSVQLEKLDEAGLEKAVEDAKEDEPEEVSIFSFVFTDLNIASKHVT